jgi:hypothetical protein
LNRGGRGGKNVLHNQILTDQREELGEKYFNRPRSVADQAIPIVPKEQRPDMANLLDIFNNTMPTDQIVEQDNSAIVSEPPRQTREEYLNEQAEVEKIVNEARIRKLEIAERDKEIVAKENAPLDIEFLKAHTIKE